MSTESVTTAVAPGLDMHRAGARTRQPVARPRSAHRPLSRRVPEDALLPREHFLGQLGREQRRSDRSKSALSIAVYRLAKHTDPELAGRLSDLLLTSKRETDIAGEIGPSTFAIICTDTDGAGVQRFVEKIESLSDDLPYAVECATYPDQLFEGLSSSTEVTAESHALFRHGHGLQRDGYFLKRTIDILGALLALLLFSPVMLLTALAVRLSSPGPIIFRQARIGQGGRSFMFLKFRSMVTHGDDRIHRDYVKSLIQGENAKANQQGPGEPLYKIKTDPRVTRVGRFIRKTSIDELPQLINVLRGDMSLVGPRPPVPYEAESYQSWHLRRVLEIKPGITGLWQVEGRSRVTFDEMVRMDLRYVRGCSLLLDLRILLKTILVVVRGDGAR